MPLPSARTIFIGGIVVIGAAFGCLMWHLPEAKPPSGGTDATAPGALARPGRPSAVGPAEGPGGRPSATAPAPKPAPKRRKVQGNPVDDLLDRWDALVAERKGPEDKMALVKEALEKLDGAGLGDFIAELHARRGGDALDWLVAQAADKLFRGPGAERGRRWARGLADEKFKERLLFEAGFRFTGAGFQEYLLSVSPVAAQESLLAGFCSALAEGDPAHALKEYAALKPKEVTNYGMKDIMKHLPEKADFAQVSTLYPDDAKTLAKEIRTEMLKRWASFRPEEALAFVSANSPKVHADQTALVVQDWSARDAGAAAAWVAKQPAGAPQDYGYVGLARQALPGSVTEAWKLASKVGDLDRRVAIATEVYLVWEKKDARAAGAAWDTLFRNVGR